MDKVKIEDLTNKVICADAHEILHEIPSESIDLVITSPPYDNIRKYKNDFRKEKLDLHLIGAEIFRVLKEGGVCVLVMQDQTINWGKTLTTFRTIVDWCDNIGFKLFECLIYRKHGAEGAWWRSRFRVDHEYMPIFVKGQKPKYFEKKFVKIPSKWGGKVLVGGATRLTSGETLKAKPIKINPFKCPGTVWEYMTCGDGDKLKHKHPATFPDKLPWDIILTFCPPDGVVLDPFCGAGTTLVAVIRINARFGYNIKYIGIDIAPEYCEIAKKRIEIYKAKPLPFEENVMRMLKEQEKYSAELSVMEDSESELSVKISKNEDELLEKEKRNTLKKPEVGELFPKSVFNSVSSRNGK